MFFFFLCNLLSFGQRTGSGAYAPITNNTLAPTAPQAYQFQKYGDLPMDIKIGLPQIQVPIHTINLKDISWSLGLKYNARGFRSSEIATSVGMGWTLEGVGIISTQVYGPMDFDMQYDEDSMIVRRDLNLQASTSGGLNCAYSNTQDIVRAENAINGNGMLHNYLPDIYNLSMPGLSMKFFIHNDIGYTIPASDTKISLQRFYTGSNFDRAVITIQDEKGAKYYFSTKGYSKANTVCLTGSSRVNISKSPIFYIDSVKTLKEDVLKFSYHDENYTYTGKLSINWNEKMDYMGGDPCANFNPGQYAQTCNTNFTIKEAFLDKITSSNGETVQFIYSARTDISGTSRVDTVIIGQAYNLKKVVLSTSYFGTVGDSNLRLRLDSITAINIQNNQQSDKFIFQYSTVALPATNSLGGDHWGFYNDNEPAPNSNPKNFYRNPNL